MPTLFIAEVSSNHHRDLNRCFAFIDKAVEIGCDAVKFQLFKLEELFSPEVLATKPEVLKRKQWELPVSFLPALSERCRARGLLFSCTPFYIDAVNELLPYVDFYKVASYELMWDDLLCACAATGKPLVLSTGMATMDEIRHAVDVVEEGFQASGFRFQDSSLPPLTLLHCVSGYPAPAEQCNLSAIETLRKAFAPVGHSHTPTLPHSHTVAIGWSDHSVNADVILRAARRWGASVVEFHLDLDGDGAEYVSGHCWLPEQIGEVIARVRAEDGSLKAEGGGEERAEGGNLKAEVGESGEDPQLSAFIPQPPLPMDGDGLKGPAPVEQADREWRADPSDGLRPLKGLRKTLA